MNGLVKTGRSGCRNRPKPDGSMLPAVIRTLGIGKTTWWNGVRTGRFPRPVKLGPRTSAWRVEDIRTLIANLTEHGSNPA